jgi:hypothetical protein
MSTRLFRNRFGQGQGKGQDIHGGVGRNRRRGAGDKPGSGPGGNCVCPKCGHQESHVAGQRCLDRVYPKCGTKMTRA